MVKVIENLILGKSVKSALVIAAYKEFENLRELLTALDKLLPPTVAIVVADDTGQETQIRIQEIVQESLPNGRNWLISFSNIKSGRGSAVLRGFELAALKFPAIEYFGECDADGSHRPIDIAEVLLSPNSDFVIGSRYLPKSRIEGWPISRRIASRLLNFLIPKALNLETSDVTNGLRRYSHKSAKIIISHKQKNSGFIFLSEQALLLSKSGINSTEIPIVFVNRIHGESSVGLSEIIDSLRGVVLLYLANRRS
jgi:dolichol-phosphate mannosyltransferase